jgi:hypothetical protein
LFGFEADDRSELGPDVVERIASGDTRAAVDKILADKRGLHLAVVLLVSVGDWNAASAVAGRFCDDAFYGERESLFRARASGLDAVIALAHGRADDSLRIVDEVLRARDTRPWLEWPTWHILRALALVELGKHKDAAVAALGGAVEDREFSVLACRVAVGILGRANLEVPQPLAEVSSAEWVRPSKRRSISKVIPTVEGGTERASTENFVATTARGNCVAASPTPLPQESAGLPCSDDDDESVVEEKWSPPSGPPSDEGHDPERFPTVQESPTTSRGLDSSTDSMHPSQEKLRSCISEYRAEQLRLASASQKADFVAAQDSLKRLQELKDLIAGLDASNRKELGACASDVPPLDVAAITRPTFLDAYVAAFKQAFERRTSQAAEELKRRKSALGQRFRQLQLPVPGELDAIGSLGEFFAFEERCEPDLLYEKCYREVEAGDTAPGCLTELPPEKRIAMVKRLATDSRVGVSPARLLEILEHEKDATGDSRRVAFALAKDALTLLLDAGKPLPHGAWKVLATLSDEGFEHVLDSEGILRLLEGRPASEIDAEGLAAIFQGDVAELGEPLRRAVRTVRALRFPPEARVRELASIVVDSPAERSTVRLLLQALLDAGENGKALYLAVLGARSGWLDLCEEELKDSLVLSVLDVCDNELRGKGLVHDLHLFQNADWLTSSDDDVVLLLALFAAGGLLEEFIDFRYRKNERLQAVRRAYPETTARLIETIERSARERIAIVDAVGIVQELEHDLQKRSCYASWPPAESYQPLFREKLSAMRSAAIRRQPVVIPTSDEVIDDAQSEGGLPVVEGDGRKAMRKYLEKQFERIRRVEEVLAVVPRGVSLVESFTRDDGQFRKELANLAREGHERKAIGRVCQRLAEAGDGS